MAEYLKSLLDFSFRLALILIPILTFLELLKGRWTDRKPKGICGLLSPEGTLALLVGLLFGLLYGAGVIISSLKGRGRPPRDAEDTLLFVAAGADPLFLVVPRAVLALFFFLVFRYLPR